MPVYDTFGFASSDLEQVKKALEDCLGIQFVPHESSFRGDYYLYEAPNGQRLSLESNVDPEDGGPQYLEFSNFPTVLFVGKADHHEELRALLEGRVAGCKLLRHKVVA